MVHTSNPDKITWLCNRKKLPSIVKENCDISTHNCTLTLVLLHPVALTPKKKVHGGLTLSPEEVRNRETGLFCEKKKKKSWPGHRPPVPYKAAFLFS